MKFIFHLWKSFYWNMFIASILLMLTFSGTRLWRKTRPWCNFTCKQRVCAQISALSYLFFFESYQRYCVRAQCYYIHSFTVLWRTEVKNDFIYHYSASADKTEFNSFFSPDPRNGVTIQRQTSTRELLVIQTAFFRLLAK